MWLAWGVAFAEMAARIEAIRRRTGSALLARPQDYEVGCIMIAQPVKAFHVETSTGVDLHPACLQA